MNFILTALVISSFFIAIVNCGKNFRTDGVLYYSSYPEKANWYQAQRYCALLGMRFIDIPTFAENSRIKRTIAKIDKFYSLSKASSEWWTSGINLATGSHFYWDENGMPFLYTNWDKDQPNNWGGNEHCSHFNTNHLWNDTECNKTFYFLCRATHRS